MVTNLRILRGRCKKENAEQQQHLEKEEQELNDDEN